MNFAFYTPLKIFGYIVFVSFDWSLISNKRLKFNDFFISRSIRDKASRMLLTLLNR